MKRLLLILSLVSCLWFTNCSPQENTIQNGATLIYADHEIKIIQIDSIHYVISGRFDANHSGTPAVYNKATGEIGRIYLYEEK